MIFGRKHGHQRVDVIGIDRFGNDAQAVRIDAQEDVLESGNGRLATLEACGIVIHEGQEVVLELLANRAHRHKVVTGRGVHSGEDLWLFAFGQILSGRGEVDDDGSARSCNDEDAGKRSVPAAQEPLDAADDQPAVPVWPPRPLLLAIEVDVRARRGDDRDGNEHRGQDGGGDGDGDIGVELACLLLNEDDGNKDEHCGER